MTLVPTTEMLGIGTSGIVQHLRNLLAVTSRHACLERRLICVLACTHSTAFLPGVFVVFVSFLACVAEAVEV